MGVYVERMKADPSHPRPEPPPLPEPFDDDHYFDDDQEPSWWATIRPHAASRPAPPPPAPTLAPRRIRLEADEVCATAHVLRVRAKLTAEEQRMLDDLLGGDSAADIITMLVNRSEDDAIANLRRRMDDEPTGERSTNTLAGRIAALAPLLSAAEQRGALSALSSLWPEEQEALLGRLSMLAPPEAAVLVRTYLAPACSYAARLRLISRAISPTSSTTTAGSRAACSPR